MLGSQWIVGNTFRTNLVVDGEDTPLVVLPELSYYGKRFFLNNFELGYTLFENDRHQLNALFTPSYDQMLFSRWDPLNFTANSGNAGGMQLSSPPVRSYQLELETPNKNLGGPIEDGNTSLGESTSSPPIAPGFIPEFDTGRLPQPTEVFTVVVSGGDYIELNGTAIAIEELNGRLEVPSKNGNITLSEVDGGVEISGLSRLDQVALISSEPTTESAAIASQVSLITADVDASLVEVTPQLQEPEQASSVSIDTVAKRRAAGLIGLEYSYLADRFSLHFQALKDATSVHDGSELRMALTLPWSVGSHNFARYAKYQ